MNQVLSCGKLPNKNVAVKSRSHKIFELFAHEQISDVILILSKFSVAIQQLATEVIEACLQLRPRKNHLLLLTHFHPLDPKRHFFKFNSRS